jgi:hypothetical protein
VKDYGDMFDDDGLQFKWNASSLAAFLKCPRYYQLNTLEGWTLRDGDNVHLRFGSVYANALQRYYVSRHEGADREEAIREAVRLALIETWDGDGPWESSHPAKDRFTLIRTIVWYFEEFRDDLPIFEVDGHPAVEQPFSIEVDNGNVFVGTLDRGVLYSDAKFIMDQKTTGSAIGKYYFEGYKPDTQMSMYTFAGRAVFDTPIKGVIIDAAQIMVSFSRFGRAITYRTDAELEEWYHDTLATIERAREMTRKQHFPMNPASCGNYGGCVFRRICSRSPEVRKQFLISDFEQKGKE